VLDFFFGMGGLFAGALGVIGGILAMGAWPSLPPASSACSNISLQSTAPCGTNDLLLWEERTWRTQTHRVADLLGGKRAVVRAFKSSFFGRFSR